ncbi:protein lifeguard 1-like isoform X1 [Neodiprion virginianus]|uniref:protein lifeguard 1-like isoform X1 n=1 Tax=Neodiprion virginianus TaxID=2961670 RepID=UPI001EE77ACE|nr:protein lifeguard 1-like isoform X1 [Neodiprion virginianus]XP_046606868.1 protein lifeguard 1-like isoform X1 [Neodiprion virginianus]XP_046606869.1 protein lifeguard 1-like isoform X1 [Neodiprion virginianus]XP_046606870.1 protein lifeguard 1-like isoform X1 [Neodiprion virginianus]XP_046606871.1 protein lifeguard 1-like isoform X1 [Neodiprion virginianus]
MSTWQQTPGTGYYPGQQGPNTGYPSQNPGYPPQNPGYPPSQGYPPPQDGYNPGYPPAYPGGNPPAAGFVPPMNPPYGQVPPNSGTPFTPPPMQAGMYGTSYAEDPMQDEIKGFDFSEQSIRRGFIRKVYAILMVQLLITIGFIALFLFHPGTKHWFSRHTYVFYIALIATFVLLIAMSCCSNLRRQAPMNYIFLLLFTVAEGIVLGAASSTYQVDAVLMAAGITAVVCFALTIFAFQTKWDFTLLSGVLFVAVIILFVFAIVAIFVKGKIFTLIYASLGALIFSVYLVFDTQLMMGGKHKYSISPEEYIFAALNLYLDIVNIFIYILTIIAASRD